MFIRKWSILNVSPLKLHLSAFNVWIISLTSCYTVQERIFVKISFSPFFPQEGKIKMSKYLQEERWYINIEKKNELQQDPFRVNILDLLPVILECWPATPHEAALQLLCDFQRSGCTHWNTCCPCKIHHYCKSIIFRLQRSLY